jgi:flagellar basal-body rod protein FlgB
MFPIHKAKFEVLERSLNAAAMRQKVIADNIANVDTPRYKRAEVHFEEMLRKEMDSPSLALNGFRTHEKHFPIGQPSFRTAQPVITRDERSAMNNNMNNVDIDYEMTLMAKNQLRYHTLIGQVSNELKHIRTAIDGRR